MSAIDYPEPGSPSHRSLVATVQSRGGGADDAAAALVNAYLPLIKRHCRPVPQSLREDAMSVGTEGFLRAVNRYDPAGGASLGTYATYHVRGAVSEFLRRETAWRNLESIDRLEELGKGDVDWTQARSVGVQGPDLDMMITVRDWVRLEPEGCRRLLHMHFYEGVPQAEIARYLGVSRAAVSQRLKRILRRARVELC